MSDFHQRSGKHSSCNSSSPTSTRRCHSSWRSPSWRHGGDRWTTCKLTRCVPLRASSNCATREHVDPAPDGSGYLPDRLPLSLLLVIFSIAERLTDDEHPVPKDGTMWSAGESYLSAAKHMISALLPLMDLRWPLTLVFVLPLCSCQSLCSVSCFHMPGVSIDLLEGNRHWCTQPSVHLPGRSNPHGSRYGAESKLGQVSRGVRNPLYRCGEGNTEPYLVVCSRS